MNAQQQAAPSTSTGTIDESRDSQFNGYTLMVEAYLAIWLILMGWLFLIWRSQQRLTSRVVGLEAAIARAEQRVLAKDARKDADEGAKA